MHLLEKGSRGLGPPLGQRHLPIVTAKTNTFSFAGLELRSVTIEGKPEFHAADVCKQIGIGNPTMALRPLKPDERSLKTFEGKLTNFVTESGLYSLVLRAQKRNPKVAEFQTWVTGTVLPTIRQTGGYIAGEEKLATGEMDDEQQDAVSVWRVGLPVAISVLRLPD